MATATIRSSLSLSKGKDLIQCSARSLAGSLARFMMHFNGQPLVIANLLQVVHHGGIIHITGLQIAKTVHSAHTSFEVFHMHAAYSVTENFNPVLRVPRQHYIAYIQILPHPTRVKAINEITHLKRRKQHPVCT